MAEVVQSLEEQYDAFTAGQEGLLGDDPDNMPTAEELGAEFERFLAEQQGRSDSPDTGGLPEVAGSPANMLQHAEQASTSAGSRRHAHRTPCP